MIAVKMTMICLQIGMIALKITMFWFTTGMIAIKTGMFQVRTGMIGLPERGYHRKAGQKGTPFLFVSSHLSRLKRLLLTRMKVITFPSPRYSGRSRAG
jgi:hypothetical protein